ncbi:Phosphinothricin N-acetyltransferase, putative [Photobacterium angustum S14]|uniref:Phosphinothricin N-acetyltransferase, putative n=1 Tax=Photobacterium angustum (strain S14 / CCUG 15956) TaxID=314292 RepID=Q1ZRV6_PHOAS|nr:GNAT family N-acetyltransferase [Photobacterium angustum]EAS65221.1 Phosphinothricin N-acetyltransferase, putative [Photobacterium angustum S14]
MDIRTVNKDDAGAIAKIYNYYVNETIITFEETELTEDQMRERISKIQDTSYPWLVLEKDGDIIGFAYASPWHTKSAYRYTAESTIYISNQNIGGGYGRALYQALLTQLKAIGIKNVMALIALPNDASVLLNEALGFNLVGEYNNVGFKFDRFISVGCWQLEFKSDT